MKENPMPDRTYNETVAEYAAQLRGLFASPEGALEEKRTRGVTVDTDVLAERAATLADISQDLGSQTSNFLDSDDLAERQAAEVKLLAQANAEMEVASALFAAVEEDVQPPKEGRRAGGVIASAARSVDELAGVLEAPLERGMAPFMDTEPSRGGPTDPAKAIASLQDQVRRSLRDISRQASKTSSNALDTLFSLDSAMLKKAIRPINKEISELAEKVAEGLNDKIKSLLRTAVRLLLQAYDWVLALIGKDREEQARKKVQEWIEELRSSHKKEDDTSDLAQDLISRLFATEVINGEVADWVKDSKAGAEAVNQASEAIQALSAGFAVKADQIQRFLKTIGAIPGAAAAAAGALAVINPAVSAAIAGFLPTIEVVRGAVTLGLMGYVLFAGYDHVDSGKANFFKRFSVDIPDRVSGVRETVQKALVVS
jgi:hypothetical protein